MGNLVCLKIRKLSMCNHSYLYCICSSIMDGIHNSIIHNAAMDIHNCQQFRWSLNELWIYIIELGISITELRISIIELRISITALWISIWVPMIKEIELLISMITHTGFTCNYHLWISVNQIIDIHNSIMDIHHHRVCSLWFPYRVNIMMDHLRWLSSWTTK